MLKNVSSLTIFSLYKRRVGNPAWSWLESECHQTAPIRSWFLRTSMNRRNLWLKPTQHHTELTLGHSTWWLLNTRWRPAIMNVLLTMSMRLLLEIDCVRSVYWWWQSEYSWPSENKFLSNWDWMGNISKNWTNQMTGGLFENQLKNRQISKKHFSCSLEKNVNKTTNQIQPVGISSVYS